jgi:hypothetical protein
MANELERPAGDSRGARGKPVEITARNARLDARDLQFGDGLALDEIRLTGAGIAYRSGTAGSLKIEALDATLVVTEAAFNRFLESNTDEPFSGLQASLLNGKMRLSGRYRMFVPIPFTITAVPELEGGARLRLDSKQMSLVGAPSPGFGVEMIGEKINAQLSRAFDATRLPIPVRLTQLTVETGRFLLHATTSLEITGT